LVACFGSVGALFSILLVYMAIETPEFAIKTYVSGLVLMMGIIGLLRLSSRRERWYRPRLLAGFAALAGFNKGIGGGGFGPVVMLGQVFSGIYEKSATAIVSLAEGLVGGTFCLRKLKAEFSVPNITMPFTDFTYPLCPRKLEAGYSSHYCWINTQYPVDCPLVSAKLSSQKPCVTGILIVSGLHQALLDQAIKDHGSVYISYMVGKSRNQLILPAAKTPR